MQVEVDGDTLRFKHAGLDCKVVRHKFGHLNGYVGVPRDHPDWGKPDDINLEVHGGITYTGEQDGLWWFGFDTSHITDWDYVSRKGKYWTIEEVIDETKRLAQQLAFRWKRHQEESKKKNGTEFEVMGVKAKIVEVRGWVEPLTCTKKLTYFVEFNPPLMGMVLMGITAKAEVVPVEELVEYLKREILNKLKEKEQKRETAEIRAKLEEEAKAIAEVMAKKLGVTV